jgi:hypothetical protein
VEKFQDLYQVLNFSFCILLGFAVFVNGFYGEVRFVFTLLSSLLASLVKQTSLQESGLFGEAAFL